MTSSITTQALASSFASSLSRVSRSRRRLSSRITTYSPLKRFGKPGDKVGVIGIGGLGHIALQFAAAMGFSEAVSYTHLTLPTILRV